jgi:hypothetical protein
MAPVLDNPLYEALLWAIKTSQSLKSELIADYLANAPTYYYKWWMNLYHEAPLHVLVETGLILFIVWLVFIRRTVDPSRASRMETFSDKEVNWLIETWQPEPLVPVLSEVQEAVSESMMVQYLIEHMLIITLLMHSRQTNLH